jgi:putative ABC transport system ATP-binding protein
MRNIIMTQGLTKIYKRGSDELRALDNVSFSVDSGEFISIIGSSGSGKSTLMNILGCLDIPSGGRYYLKGRNVAELSPAALCKIRSKEIGFVFQSFHLIGALSALENVELPLLYSGIPAKTRREKALAALDLVGLSSRVNHKPRELSGGQMQRVACARAIVTNPSIILADEPTGNLDSKMSAQVMALLRELNRLGKTVILITHDSAVAAQTDRQIAVFDGKIVNIDE